MSDYSNFKKCLKFGKAYELKAQQKIMNYYKNKYKIKEVCNDNKYDFVLSNGKSYEVKVNRKAYENGHIFIENKAFNKASGISVTHATYYIIVLLKMISFNMFQKPKLSEIFLKISVNKIKKLILKGNFTKYYEDDIKSGYLITIDTILKYSTELT